MKLVDLSVKDAEAFLSKHERHYKAPVEAICAIGVADSAIDVDLMSRAIPAMRAGGLTEKEIAAVVGFDPNALVPVNPALHGAAILGRREAGVGELAHIYVDGASQGYSLLYGACWRALKALGYERAVL